MDEGKDSFNWKNFLENSKVSFKAKWGQKVKSQLNINDFVIMRTIGTGAYGRVLLAKERKGEKHYAIKVLEKESIFKARQIEHIKTECSVLQATNFPFIINMEHYFKDNVYLYFVLPFVPGGELYSLLRKVGKFHESQSRFYTSQIVLAFEYLHFFSVVYRDLKPENILIAADGYLKLTDFGFCKVLKERTYTICGTPEYLAPEVVQCRGYGLSVDWWALGVLMYEMTAGFPPFYSMDKVTLYEQITSGSFRMIPSFSESLKDLLMNLLKTDPQHRYGGTENGVIELKNHTWFNGLNWIDILNKKEKAPFIPQLMSPDDTRYYDTYNEETLKISSRNFYENEFKDF